MATTAVTMFKGTGTITAAGGGAAVNVAHGLAAAPTMFWAVAQTLSPTLAALVSVVPTADITNVILTPNAAPAADIVFDVFAFVAAEVGSDVDTLANQTKLAGLGNALATSFNRATVYQTGYTRVRQYEFPCVDNAGGGAGTGTAPITAAGNCTLGAATTPTLAATFPNINFAKTLEIWTDNPFCKVAVTSALGSVTTIVVTNSDGVDAQHCKLFVKEIHSINR